MFVRLVFVPIVLAAYFVPSIVAAGRNHSEYGTVVRTNVLLGWTGVGWIAALVWAIRTPALLSAPSPHSSGDGK